MGLPSYTRGPRRQGPTALYPPRLLSAQAPLDQYHYASHPVRRDSVTSRPLPPVPSRRHYYTIEVQLLELLAFLPDIPSPFILIGGYAVTFYLKAFNVVPYTNRGRFIMFPAALERILGEAVLDIVKKEMGGRVLPPLHPDSVRVRRIASEIVDAINRGLAAHHRHKASAITPDDAVAGIAAQQDDDEERRNREAKPHTSNLLDGWEVIVVKHDAVNALCAPGGKIIVFTGLLDKLERDAEIATVLGHEFAHAIARHTAEDITKVIVNFIVHFFTLQFLYRPGVRRCMSIPLKGLRMHEVEADHIGLLLLAAAGYDPRFAPSVYETIGKISSQKKKIGKIVGDDIPSTEKEYHPQKEYNIYHKLTS